MPLDLFFFFDCTLLIYQILFFFSGGRGGGARSFSNQAKIHFVRQDKEIMLVGAGAFLLTLMAVIFIQSTTAANSSGQEALSATVRGLAAMLVHTHWGGRRGKEKHEGVGELRGGGMLVDLEIGIVQIKRFSFSFMFLHFTCSHHTVNWKQAWSDLQLCFNLEHNLFNSADYWIYIKLTQHLPSRIYSPPLFNFVGLR